MTRYGIIADVHGNLEALSAVLADLDALQVATIVCLGDVVGYNADPDACAAILAGRGIPSIAGNHDLIALRRLGLSRCSNKAAFALRRTRRAIGATTRRYLEALPAQLILDDRLLLVHGGIGDVQMYLRRADQVADNAKRLRAAHPGIEVCFFGHTHEPALFACDGEGNAEMVSAQERVRLDSSRLWFVNPGSVDASRKRAHKLAEYALFDPSSRELELRRVPYDDGATEEKAARGGYRIDPWTDRYYTLRRRGWAAVRKAGRLLGFPS